MGSTSTQLSTSPLTAEIVDTSDSDSALYGLLGNKGCARTSIQMVVGLNICGFISLQKPLTDLPFLPFIFGSPSTLSLRLLQITIPSLHSSSPLQFSFLLLFLSSFFYFFQMAEYASLLPPSWQTKVTEWIHEDIPSFDYGGFVVGNQPEKAILWGKTKASKLLSCLLWRSAL